MMRRLIWALVAMGTLVACGDETKPRPDLTAIVFVRWPDRPSSAAELGYTIEVSITQSDAWGPCRPLPASTRVIVNGQTAPQKPGSECLSSGVIMGPLVQAQPVDVQVEAEGQVVAEAHFDGLMPGLGAVLASPADGRVRAGDEIVVVPPPGLLPGRAPPAVFFPLQEATWEPDGISALERSVRLFDGIHARVPAFLGPAVAIFYVPEADFTTESSDEPSYSCPGFADCSAYVDLEIGPLLVEGVP